MVVPHALIGGGSGFIGKRLLKHLTQYGYDVTLISRMPGVNRITWHELEQHGVPAGVTSVINLAGHNVLDPKQRWSSSIQQNVWNSRIYTNAALAKAVIKAPEVQSLINISGVSAYLPGEVTGNADKEYTEEDETKVFNYLSKLCVETEKAAELPDDANHKCRTVKIRTGNVLGHDGGMLKFIYMPLFLYGFGGTIGKGEQYLPWIHLDDLVRLIKHCIETEECDGVLHGVAPDIITNAEFSEIFATRLNRPCFFNIPETVVKMMFGEDASPLLLTGAKIQPKLTLETGFQFKYPTIAEACVDLIKESDIAVSKSVPQ